MTLNKSYNLLHLIQKKDDENDKYIKRLVLARFNVAIVDSIFHKIVQEAGCLRPAFFMK